MTDSGPIAFVLGGGGVHGAVQVGMASALEERGIIPDLVIGTSIGALNGAMIAADPTAAPDRLRTLWERLGTDSPFEASLIERAATFARTRTHLHSDHGLRRLLLTHLPVRTFEDLAIPFACVAASVERAGARWFEHGPLIEALLASSAVPGLLPAAVVDGEHHLDGGLVDSIPIGRALAAGARTIYVLQVGRVEQPLRPPRSPFEVGLVAFEIARRHRFVEVMSSLPDDATVHLLPSGVELGMTDPAQFRYRDLSQVTARIDGALAAARDYLDDPLPATGPPVQPPVRRGDDPTTGD